MDRKAFGMGIVATLVAALLLFLIIGLTVVYTGAYNIAATEDHSPFVRWAFTTTMHNSVEGRAEEVAEPPSFTSAMIEAGAPEYKSMCEHCHGGPGIDRADWAGGMLPQPPHLTEAAGEWEAREIFWLVKHGVKMSAMPAFGSDHSDDTIWNITAFVQQLPGMTEQQYAAFESHDSHQH